MRVLFYLASAFTLSLALPQGSQELVATDDCPEVVPGPGLPSLASLNLTSADLCKSPEEFQMSLYGQVESPSSAQDSANDEKQLVKSTMRPIPRRFSWGTPAGPAQAGGFLPTQDESRGGSFVDQPRPGGRVDPAWAGGKVGPAGAVLTNLHKQDEAPDPPVQF
ncbi:hypothetical protein CC1G_11907 [Coprinopsis cinerea okayama7|uniref:Uncharacterized protein n=1 Tax=Coprinopsis cinerea (strain Okayama-7 / 130 / ATCC MYA-4618 / FGSC 9003) TaxID=240176 RepID=A8NDC8_COPC7|nr:hypothetical protein CC1G_11907 [Coprinopsis cinerea okayama7\|eukprot:XP_001832743.1 hypothetical protein CC1G_11907 [Coprinopsis cinerea okayama7\